MTVSARAIAHTHTVGSYTRAAIEALDERGDAAFVLDIVREHLETPLDGPLCIAQYACELTGDPVDMVECLDVDLVWDHTVQAVMDAMRVECDRRSVAVRSYVERVDADNDVWLIHPDDVWLYDALEGGKL